MSKGHLNHDQHFLSSLLLRSKFKDFVLLCWRATSSPGLQLNFITLPCKERLSEITCKSNRCHLIPYAQQCNQRCALRGSLCEMI